MAREGKCPGESAHFCNPPGHKDACCVFFGGDNAARAQKNRKVTRSLTG